MHAPRLLTHQKYNIRNGIAEQVEESLRTGEAFNADRVAEVVFEEISDLEDAFGVEMLEDWAERNGYVKTERVK